MRSTAILALLLVALPACQSEKPETEDSPGLERIEVEGIERVSQSSTVYLSSQPTKAGFANAKARGVKTVLDLRRPQETDHDDRALVTGEGLEYVNVPIAGLDGLTDDNFAAVREILRDPSRRPILVHCASANRVGAVWYAYRRLDQGISAERALWEAREVGLSKKPLETRAVEYVTNQRP